MHCDTHAHSCRSLTHKPGMKLLLDAFLLILTLAIVKILNWLTMRYVAVFFVCECAGGMGSHDKDSSASLTALRSVAYGKSTLAYG